MFTISETRDPEGETFWVRHERKSLTIICAETGNGGKERFELGWPKHDRTEGYDAICFASNRSEALMIAKRELINA
jgi:hypothetical protein